jgi:hypothetical protein
MVSPQASMQGIVDSPKIDQELEIINKIFPILANFFSLNFAQYTPLLAPKCYFNYTRRSALVSLAIFTNLQHNG